MMGRHGAGRTRRKTGVWEKIWELSTLTSAGKQSHDESKKQRGGERLTSTDRQRVKVKMTERQAGGGTERMRG